MNYKDFMFFRNSNLLCQKVYFCYLMGCFGISCELDSILNIDFCSTMKAKFYIYYSDLTAINKGSEHLNLFLVLTNLKEKNRLLLKYNLSETLRVFTFTNLFKGVQWSEREIWDMFGIKFDGNLDLRRILSDYGFIGHPLRKSFPVVGYLAIRYNTEESYVCYGKVELVQGNRFFKIINPWLSSASLIKAKYLG